MNRNSTFLKLVWLLLCVAVMCPTVAQSPHPWAGKRVAYFGDSITDPKNNGSKQKYWHFLQQWLDVTPWVYAVSGREWNDIPRQAAQLKAEHADSVDAILVMIGTNDYNHGVPIGHWYTETVERVEAAIGEPKRLMDRRQRHMAMDADTYRGRINIAIDSLKRAFPTKQIVLLTPIHRAGFYPNERNWQPTEDYTNRAGIYLDEYVNSVKEAGNIWALPVIDLNAVSGLYPMSDGQAVYFKDADTDRLHPNDFGHQRIAKTLMYQLSALPCSFE